VVQRCAQLRLAHEALLDLARAVRVQPLDGDATVEPLVVAEQHGGHAAGPEPAQHPVAPSKKRSLRQSRHASFTTRFALRLNWPTFHGGLGA
jgi:hypothetical protein